MNNSTAWVREDLEGGIARITLNRPPVNALSPEVLMDFAALMGELGRDSAVRAIVIGSALKVFSAGLDLKEAVNFDRAAQNDIVEGLNVGFLALYACPKPTVAAVGGAAIAGGLFFVLGSDVRVAGPRASFGLAEVRVGVDFPVGPMEIARATLSPDLLRRLMLTGQPLSAQDAHRLGIVDHLVEAEGVADHALSTARALAQIPPGAYASVKQQIRGAVTGQIEQAMAQGANAPKDGWFSDETCDAMRRMIG